MKCYYNVDSNKQHV